MTHLLVADVFRRHWRMGLFALATITLMWSALPMARRHGPPIDVAQYVGIPLALGAIGVWLCLVAVAPGIAPLLPVSRRQIWRARWITGVVGPAAIVIGAGLLHSISGWRPADLDTVGLAVFYSVTASGTVLGLVAALGRPRFSHRWRLVDGSLFALTFVAMFATPVVGFFLADRLPTRWDDVGGVPALVCGVALAVAVATFFYTPPLSARGFGDLRHAPKAPRRRRWLPWLDTVTGLQTIVLREAGVSLLGGALVLVFLSGEALGFEALSRFDIGLLGFLMVSLVNWLRPVARQLKTLPIGTRRLAAYLTGLPLLRWAGFLMVLAAVKPDALWYPGLSGLIALSTVAHAIDWRTRAKPTQLAQPGSPFPWGMWAAMMPVIVCQTVLRQTAPDPGSLIWIAVALFAFGLAYTLNHDTFTRRDAAFRVRAAA